MNAGCRSELRLAPVLLAVRPLPGRRAVLEVRAVKSRPGVAHGVAKPVHRRSGALAEHRLLKPADAGSTPAPGPIVAVVEYSEVTDPAAVERVAELLARILDRPEKR